MTAIGAFGEVGVRSRVPFNEDAISEKGGNECEDIWYAIARRDGGGAAAGGEEGERIGGEADVERGERA